jgi:hypothetical protein
MRDNWDKTSLATEWTLYDDDGRDPEAGYEYPCGIGNIDLLAKHKTERHWLVVELKRGQNSDSTVGQMLRYMGWIETHLAGSNEKVYGLIITREADDKLLYAARAIPSVGLLLYKVQFQLQPVPASGQEQGGEANG